VGDGDIEHPHSTPGGSLLLQRKLTQIVDRHVTNDFATKIKDEARWFDIHRMKDLVAPGADHTWMWAMHPHKCKPMSDEEFVYAIRMRLGCGGPEDSCICANCSKHIITFSGEHCLHCAKGESTTGHNRVRDELHAMAHSVDAAAETEPEGLVASYPLLRPADILTGAFHHGRLAAMDVGIISPTARGAGHDSVETMHRRKSERMEIHADELASANVEYHPFAVTCWGRLHPEAAAMLTRLAKRMARRNGSLAYHNILLRLRAKISMEIWRRAARMALKCVTTNYDDEAEALVEVSPNPLHALRAGDPAEAELPLLVPVASLQR